MSKRMHRCSRYWVVVSSLLCGLLGPAWLGLSSELAHAATFTVTNLNDNGAGSLREAITAANNAAGDDTINFASGVTGIIQLAGGLPNLDSNITIQGPGANLLTVRRNTGGHYRIFTVPGGKTVSLSGLTVANGYPDPGEMYIRAAEDGGGIKNSGALTLTACTVSGNTAFEGGGIDSNGTLTIFNSTISGNTANYVGGGLSVTQATIQNSTISSNRAVDNGRYGAGGGIGGGIDTNGPVTMNSVTVTKNTGISRAAGIHAGAFGGAPTLYNCIVADNLFSDNTPGDYGSSGSGSTPNGSNNFIGGDAKLGPLQDNGGPTLTHRPLRGSPVIDTGETGLTTDQIGNPRPFGSADDKGAVEVTPIGSLIVTTLTDENDSTSDPIYGDGTSLREAIIFANSNADSSVITFAPGLSGIIQLTGPLPELATNMEILGSGAALTVRRNAGGNYSIFRIPQYVTVNISKLTIANGSAGFDGGGINNGGNLTVRDCTLSGNTAAFAGGAIYTRYGTLTISNSTLSNNTAAAEGGGICVVNGTAIIESCTITNNTAGAGKGSGVASYANSPTNTRVSNSIIAGNANSDVDLFAGSANTFQSLGYNVIGTGSATGLFMATGDQRNVSAAALKLGPLQINAPGTTATHMPLSGSPVINMGSTVLTTDQRGVARPQAAIADIGAVEYDAFSPSLVVNTLTDENNGTSDPAYGSGTSLREAIGYANSNTDASAITFDSGLTGTIQLTAALPNLSTNITITGPGAALTVQRNTGGNYRIFAVDSGATVTISTLSLTNGNAGSADGGAILNQGDLTVVRCTLSGNTATSGGAIRNQGTLTLQNSTLSSNSASTNGGGVWSNGPLTASSATFSNNTSPQGGALYSEGALTLENTILKAGTTGVNVLLGGSGTLNSLGYNISSDGTGPNTGTNDRRNLDPRLGQLQDNGGPTFTHALQSGSPALNTGNPELGGIDQRGVARPQNGRSDVGAVEFLFSTNESPVVTTLVDENDGSSDPTVGTGNATSLREAITYANSNADASTITFASSLFPNNTPGIIQLIGTLPALSTPITITGPGAKVLTVRRNTSAHYGVFHVFSGATVSISGLTMTNGSDSGLVNNGTLTLTNCAISGNNTSGSASGWGGGINNAGTLTMTGCTISGNTAKYGGGIWNSNFNSPAILTARNCTISSNTATSYGGGITDSESKLVLQNCTITANTAPAGNGGGITSSHFNAPPAGQTQVSNCIIAGNVGNDIVLLDNARVTSNGYNLIGTGNIGDFNTTGDQSGITNPVLGPLSYNNNGSTQTHVPQGGSPAINTGNTDLTVDQNDVSRPQNGADDIGAVEAMASELVVTTDQDEDNGTTDPAAGTGTSLREAINAANAASSSLITFSPTVFNTPKTIVLNSSLPTITASMAITGSAAGVTIRGAAPAFNITSGTVILSDLSIVGLNRGNSIANNGSSTLRVQNCTFSGIGSVGINNFAALTVQNSTFHGILRGLNNNGGTLTVQSCTISGISGYGININSGPVHLFNSIVAGNGENLRGPLTTNTNNIIGTLAEAGLATENGAPVLKDNGGSTFTIALVPGSPAIDSGDTTLLTDQRGIQRPQGIHKDKGAFEFNTFNHSLVVTTTTNENNETSDPRFGTGTSLHEAIAYANTHPGPDTISFDTARFNTRKTITLDSLRLPHLNSDMTITGPAAGVVIHGGSNRVFFMDSGNVVLSGLTVTNPGGNASNIAGIYQEAGNLTIRNSTFSGHHEGINQQSGNITLENSTFVNNSNMIYHPSGVLTVRNCTISGNDRALLCWGGSTDLYNSIVAGNRINLEGTPTNSSNNIIGTLAQAGLKTNNGAPVLEDNGGPTHTIALLPNSPALDAGNDALIPLDSTDDDKDGNTTEPTPYDQRGAGFPRVFGSHVDIGALEMGDTMFDIADQVMPVNTSRTVNFSIANVGNGPLTVSVAADNATLLPADSLVTGGSGANRTLTITPAANQIGQATITLTVSDGNSNTTSSFNLRVTELPSLVVTTLSDTTDNIDGLNSLREAITYANSKAGDDTITFGSDLTGTISLTSALPDLSSNIILQGPASGLTVERKYDAATLFRIFKVPEGVTVSIRNLTIARGVGTSNPNNLAGGSAAMGAGILNNGTLTMQNCTLLGNEAFDHGGGIANTGTLTVQNSTIRDNDNFTLGGGIYNAGTLTVQNSTIARNLAIGTNSNGGGIYNAGSLTVQNSTIAGNIVKNNGASIYHRGTEIQVSNSIVVSAQANNVFGFTSTGGYNIIGGSAAEAGLETNSNGVILKNNGGITQTIALIAGSPALNAGDPAHAAGQANDFDQRGPGFLRVRSGRLDIGAFELQPLSNTAPTATGPDNFTAISGVGTTLTLVGSDTDNDALTYKITTLPVNGTLYDGAGTATSITTVPHTLSAKQVTYLAPSTYIGSDSFGFKVSDGTAESTEKTVVGTIIPPVASTGAIISEFRTRGPNGAGDEYVEIANTTAGPLNVSGWKLAYPNGPGEVIATIPDNTVIPKGGHLLFTGSTYSLGGAGGYATGDVTLTIDIPDNGGVALRNATGTRLDAAGFASADALYKLGNGIVASISGNGQNAFMRQQRGTPYINTLNNASDFDFVTVTGGAVDGITAKLGAPGPEGLASPTLRNDTLSAVALPIFRDTAATGTNATYGTMALRYKVTNNGTQKITRLRFRAVMIPAGGGISGGTWQTANGTADLRLLTSADTTATVNEVSVPVKGSTLEEPPAQSNGGGLNSSMSLDLSGLPAGGIDPTTSVNVQFTFGVMVKGTYRAVMNMEGLP